MLQDEVPSGEVTLWAQWPDADTAVRVLTAAGPSWPAVKRGLAEARRRTPPCELRSPELARIEALSRQLGGYAAIVSFSSRRARRPG